MSGKLEAKVARMAPCVITSQSVLVTYDMSLMAIWAEMADVGPVGQTSSHTLLIH